MARTAMRSHLHDESESCSPHPSPSPNPNPAGAERTPSGNHGISISRAREKQKQELKKKKKKKKKEKSCCSETESLAPSAATEWEGSSLSPTRLEGERRGCEGPQSDPLLGASEMFIENIGRSMGNKKSKKAKNKKHLEGNGSPQKASRVHPCHWCFSRRALLHLFLHRSRTRRSRRIQVILRRRGNKITKTTDNSYLENQSQGSSSKRRKTDKTAALRDSSVSVQRESMTEPENDSSVSVQIDIMPEPENDSFEEYCRPAYTQPLWRPPKPKEDDIWVPSHVKTNGQGRKRLLCGHPLLEIFDIEVDLCGRTKTYGNIHGKIWLLCAGYKIFLFECDKKSALMIQQKGSLPLKGSDVAPLAFDPAGIFVNLKIDDDELCEDVVVWDPCYSSTDEWLYDKLEGRNGIVHVTFSVMKQACLAELDVKLIKSAKEASSMIYGDIVVYISNMCYLRYFAFSKRCNDSSIVKPQESIPLSTSLFSCRCGSSLVVKVDLWDSDTNKPVARGALLFPPEYYGDSVGTVSGPHGMVQVKVNWVFFSDHSKTLQALGW